MRRRCRLIASCSPVRSPWLPSCYGLTVTEFLQNTACRLAAAGWPGLAAALGRLALLRRGGGAVAFHDVLDRLLAAGGVAAAERLCRSRLVVAADDRDALGRLAFLLLDAGRGAEAAACFGRLDRLDGAASADPEVLVKRHLDIERARIGETYCRWLNDVRVDTAYWSIVKDGVIYNDDVHAKNLSTSPFVRGRVSADGAMVLATLPAPQMAIDQECILVGGDDNYSHWLFRNMLKLSTLDHAGLLHRYPWLVNTDLRGYQLEYLQLLGHDPAQTIRVERNTVIRCSRLLVPALHVSTRAVMQGVEWLRGRMAAVSTPPAQAMRRLFLSRRDNGRRRLLNEEQLFGMLAPLGFERVVPGEMTVAAQIAAFSSARVIVAAHGAGLTNMVFTPPGAVIVEITSGAIEHMNLFRKLSLSTGHSVITIRSDDYAVPAAEVNVNSDYRVDALAVRRAVEQALVRAGA